MLMSVGGYCISMLVVNGKNLGYCKTYQEGNPCNQDHYSSLGKSAFILLLKCVFCA